MTNSDNSTNWNNITSNEAFRLSQAEFKGMTIQALQDIKSDIKDLQSFNSNSRYISMIIAGVAGVISGLFSGRMKV